MRARETDNHQNPLSQRLQPVHPVSLVNSVISPQQWVRSVSAIESTFKHNFWPIVSRTAANLRERWKDCRKMIEVEELDALSKNKKSKKTGLEIEESSKLDQHRRAVLIGSKFLRAAFATLTLEIRDKTERASVWRRLHSLDSVLHEHSLSGERAAHIKAEKVLDSIQTALKGKLYGDPKRGIKVLDVDRSRILSALDEEFHFINNAMGTLAGFYETLSNVITEPNSSWKPNRGAEAKKFIPTMEGCVQEISASLTKDKLRDFVMAAEVTAAAKGPADTINFNLSRLEPIFQRCLRICGAKKSSFELCLTFSSELESKVAGMNIKERSALGLVFSGLILNGVQALKKQLKGGLIEIRGHTGKHHAFFQVITHKTSISEPQLQAARNVIENPWKAKLRSKLNQGGNGLANVSVYLSDHHHLGGDKPRILETVEGVVTSFAVKV